MSGRDGSGRDEIHPAKINTLEAAVGSPEKWFDSWWKRFTVAFVSVLTLSTAVVGAVADLESIHVSTPLSDLIWLVLGVSSVSAVLAVPATARQGPLRRVVRAMRGRRLLVLGGAAALVLFIGSTALAAVLFAPGGDPRSVAGSTQISTRRSTPAPLDLSLSTELTTLGGPASTPPSWAPSGSSTSTGTGSTRASTSVHGRTSNSATADRITTAASAVAHANPYGGPTGALTTWDLTDAQDVDQSPWNGQDDGTMGGCEFTAKGYRVTTGNYFYECHGYGAELRDSTIEVRLTIVTGAAAIAFRDDNSGNHLDLLSIDASGACDLQQVNGKKQTTLDEGTCRSGASKTLAITVHGPRVRIYSGSTLVLSAHDTAFTHGHIGFIATGGRSASFVVSRVRVWS